LLGRIDRNPPLEINLISQPENVHIAVVSNPKIIEEHAAQLGLEQKTL